MFAKPSLRRWRDLYGCRGAVLEPHDLAKFDQPCPAQVRYGDRQPQTPAFPIVPLQVFGMDYDLNLVIVTEHPHWFMHEYARVRSAEGTHWLAKDADPQGRQTVIVDLPASWAAEIDVPRLQRPVTVLEEQDGDRIEVQLSYLNSRNEPVDVHFQGRLPLKAPRLRNGNTMGHSHQTLAPVLDLHGQGTAQRVTMKIGGKPVRLHRLAGLWPFAVTLRQTQAGFSQATFVQKPHPSGFVLARESGIDEAWQVRQAGDYLFASHQGAITTLTYRYLLGPEGQAELIEATVMQSGYEVPGLRLRLDHALPDPRWTWEGAHVSRFVMDVNGQAAYATGRIVSEGTRVQIRPDSPAWLANRPLETLIALGDQSATVDSRRTLVSQ